VPAEGHDHASIRTISELDLYTNDWDRLTTQAKRFYPSYAEARVELQRSPFLVTVFPKKGPAAGLACFVNRRSQQVFTVGERRLFSLSARETSMFGGDALGSFGENVLHRCLRAAFAEWPCDLFTLGEVEIGSPLHHASMSLDAGLLRNRRQRKDPVRWLIPLPSSFDDYLAALRAGTRKSVAYTLRRVERELAYTHQIVTRPDQVESFLQDGESISRRTYQWNVGQRLEHDEATRERFCRLAEQGRLRCHMLYVDGKPCAFTRGEISGRAYHYETPGFLTQYHRYSPGVVLLMWTIKDLIRNTSCTLFDFGAGGDEHGYKARFGTLPVRCKDLQFAPVWRPYSAALLAINFMLSAAKNAASKAIGSGVLRRRLKKAIRYEAQGRRSHQEAR